MKKFYFKTAIQIALLLQVCLLFSQQANDLDRLEKRLNELRNTKPDEVLKIGTYILNHSSSDRQKSYTMALMSFAYFEKKDTEKSTEMLFKSRELADRTKDPEVITRIYGTIAQMYLNMGFRDKAVYHLRKVIDEIQNMPEGDSKHRLNGLTYIELGKIDLDDKKYASANKYFKKSLAEFQKNSNSLYFVKRSYYNIGNSFYEMNRTDSAQVYLKRAMQIRENPDVNNYALFTLSKIYTNEKRYQTAVDTLISVLNRNTLHDDILKSEIYLAILKNYNALGNTAQYSLYNEKYLALNHEVSDNKLSTIKNVVRIEEKNLTTKITSAHTQNSRLLWMLLFISVAAIAILLYIRKKKKIQQKQYESIIGQLENKAVKTNSPNLAQPLKDPGSPMISAEIEQGILEKLARFEQSDKFTNPKLNISMVSVQLKTNTTYLSQVINKYKGKNFSAYINALRINYICEKIHNNPEYLAYKISYLAELAGFTSHSTFAVIFKNVTGMSPSTFLHEAEKNNRQKPY